MREELVYPEIETENFEIVKNLIDYIAESTDVDVEAEIKKLEHITGKRHEPNEFLEYWGWTDLDSLVEKTLMPEPPCVKDLTKKEVTEIVLIIKECLVTVEDNKAEYYIELLHKSLPLPNVIEFIMQDIDAEKIAQNMLSAARSSVIQL